MLTPRHSPDSDDFRVLFICTANLCRSPIAEYLFDRAVSSAWPGAGTWLVESAGVSAPDEQPMHRKAAKVLAESGIDGAEFRTRRLRPSMVHTADLILTATRDHRSYVARMLPAALNRLFTVNQFGYLLSHAPPGPRAGGTAAVVGQQLIAAARSARAVAPARTVADDLEDPVNRPVGKFRAVRELLADDFGQVTRFLAPH